MNKKLLIAVTSFALLTGLLAGCNKKKTSSSEEQKSESQSISESTSKESETSEPDKEFTLKVVAGEHVTGEDIVIAADEDGVVNVPIESAIKEHFTFDQYFYFSTLECVEQEDLVVNFGDELELTQDLTIKVTADNAYFIRYYVDETSEISFYEQIINLLPDGKVETLSKEKGKEYYNPVAEDNELTTIDIDHMILEWKFVNANYHLSTGREYTAETFMSYLKISEQATGESLTLSLYPNIGDFYYVLTFIAGEHAHYDDQGYNYESYVRPSSNYKLPDPHKIFTFDEGWYGLGYYFDPEYPGPEYDIGEAYTLTEDKTIYLYSSNAQFVHIFGHDYETYKTIEGEDVTYGSTVTLPELTAVETELELTLPENAEFKGWALTKTPASTDTLYQPGETYTIDKDWHSYGPICFYPVLESTEAINAVYHENGDANHRHYSNGTVRSGRTLDLSNVFITSWRYDNDNSREFLGWALSATGEAVYAPDEVILVPFTEETTFELYCVWNVPSPIMVVDDAFALSGRGTVVTGTLLVDLLNSGDEIDLIQNGTGERIQTLVAGIEKNKTAVESATKGDSVGILLRGVDRDAVNRGDSIVFKNDQMARTTFHVSLYQLTKDEGGTHTPFFPKARFDISYHDVVISNAATLVSFDDDAEMILPGETKNAIIKTNYFFFAKGDTFVLRSGGRTVMRGTIL